NPVDGPKWNPPVSVLGGSEKPGGNGMKDGVECSSGVVERKSTKNGCSSCPPNKGSIGSSLRRISSSGGSQSQLMSAIRWPSGSRRGSRFRRFFRVVHLFERRQRGRVRFPRSRQFSGALELLERAPDSRFGNRLGTHRQVAEVLQPLPYAGACVYGI